MAILIVSGTMVRFRMVHYGHAKLGLIHQIGELDEMDDEGDCWVDWDENCHGRIEDQKDEYPEGFLYSCCGRTGDLEGCRIGTHVEKKDFSKRARYY